MMTDVHEDTRYLCEMLNGEWHYIANARSLDSGEHMIDTLRDNYPAAWFDLVTDHPKVKLEDVDYDTFLSYRLDLLRPTLNVSKSEPKLIVIDGGKDYDN
tara:strand:+ start:1431 stop:1730 length:300 start_codon:yes stop_codon:yes gene_type:complete